MTFVRLSANGITYEARTVALLIHYTKVLTAGGLWALVDHIQQRVFAEGAGGLVREASPEGDAFRLTEWGELTVIEIIRVATRRECSREARAAAIRLLLERPHTYIPAEEARS